MSARPTKSSDRKLFETVTEIRAERLACRIGQRARHWPYVASGTSSTSSGLI